MVSRRSVLASAIGALTLASRAVRGLAAADSDVSLRQLGRSKGIDVGSAFSGEGSAKYLDLLARHCEILTPEYQLKPRYLKPTADSSYNFAASDNIAAFCTEHGQKFHGHTLFWYREPIHWADSDDFATAKERYGRFMRDVVAQYPQAVSWDVVNEIVREKMPLRDEFMIRKFGYQFVDFCFRTVHEAAPHAQLVINDDDLECAADWCDAKRQNMLAVIGKLRSMKTPVHAVGIQSHLSSKNPPSAQAALQFIARLADLGCDVYLSEMDVNDSRFPDDTRKRDALVAEYYEGFLSTVLSHPAVKRLNFWGISDSSNWIVRGESEERRVGGAARPALFDVNDGPKPAFHAVVRALQGAPGR